MKWLPLRLIKPGKQLVFMGERYLRIKMVTTIGKATFNLIHLKTGDTAYLSEETAIQVVK